MSGDGGGPLLPAVGVPRDVVVEPMIATAEVGEPPQATASKPTAGSASRGAGSRPSCWCRGRADSCTGSPVPSCARKRANPPSALRRWPTNDHMANSKGTGGAPREHRAAEEDFPGAGYSTLTARETTTATVSSEARDCTAISSFAQPVRGIVSVGLKAVALVNEV